MRTKDQGEAVAAMPSEYDKFVENQLSQLEGTLDPGVSWNCEEIECI